MYNKNTKVFCTHGGGNIYRLTAMSKEEAEKQIGHIPGGAEAIAHAFAPSPSVAPRQRTRQRQDIFETGDSVFDAYMDDTPPYGNDSYGDHDF